MPGAKKSQSMNIRNHSPFKSSKRWLCVVMKLNKIFIITAMSFLVLSLGPSAMGYGGPPAQSSAGNYTVEIYLDKESYALGESVTFSGTVNKYDEGRDLRISIFDSKSGYIMSQKTPVNDDATFSHTLILDDEFEEGKYTAKAQYGSSKATVEIITFEISSETQTQIDPPSMELSAGPADTAAQKIPDWVKNNAGWWAAGDIDDNSFVQGIQFMIKEGLMKIPATEQGEGSQDNKIPDWVKNNAGWWAAGDIDDNSFVQGIQFMIKEGLMKISS